MYRAQMYFHNTICRRRSNNNKINENQASFTFRDPQNTNIFKLDKDYKQILNWQISVDLTRPGTLPKHDPSASLKQYYNQCKSTNTNI